MESKENRLREKLDRLDSERFVRFRNLEIKAKELLEYSQGGNHLTFTPHGLSHISKVEGAYEYLLSAEDIMGMNVAEIFCLLSATYFHDLLMIPSKAGEEELARKEHALRAKDFLKNNTDKLSLTPGEANVIGEVIKGHHVWDLSELKKSTVLGQDLVDIRKLAACLSLADICHADQTRAPQIVMSLLQLDDESMCHWNRHLSISGITRRDNQLVVSVLTFSECGEKAVKNYVSEIEKQLNVCRPYFDTVLSKIDKVSLDISSDFNPNADVCTGGPHISTDKKCRSGLECYLKHLKCVCNEVPLAKLRKKRKEEAEKTITLDQVFIDLKYYRKAETKDGDEKEQSKTLMSAATKFEHLAVLGDPGSGKSTFVNYLTYQLANLYFDECSNGNFKEWDCGKRLPVRISMVEAVKSLTDGSNCDKADPIWNHICQMLIQIGAISCKNLIKKELKDGKCLVMFDDLDSLSSEQWELAPKAIKDFLFDNRNNRFIVTCRKKSFENLEEGLIKNSVVIGELFGQQIKKFINDWYNAMNVLQDDKFKELMNIRAEKLIKALLDEGKNHLLPIGLLAESPYFLTAITLIHDESDGKELPRTRSKLYKDIIQKLLYYWLKKKSDSKTGLDILEVKKELNHWEETAYKIVNENVAGNEPVRDFHSTLQGYLAGCYIVKKSTRPFDRQLYEMTEDVKRWQFTAVQATEHLISNSSTDMESIDNPYNIFKIREAMYNLCPCAELKSEKALRGILWAGHMVNYAFNENVLDEDNIEDKYKPDGGKVFLSRIRNQWENFRESKYRDWLSLSERVEAGTIFSDIGEAPLDDYEKKPDEMWCEVPAGPFKMGSTEEDLDRQDDEIFHIENIDKPYLVGKYLVTNALYDKFEEYRGIENKRYWLEAKNAGRWNPEKGVLRDYYGGDDEGTYVNEWADMRHKYDERHSLKNHPVVGVCWFEAVAFCRWLTEQLKDKNVKMNLKSENKELESAIAKKKYEIRLPTEAEWEKAARWRNEEDDFPYIYPWGYKSNESEGNFGYSTNLPSAVGIFPKGKSPCGCLDMSGNVWEWCQNKYTKDYKKLQEVIESLEGEESRVLRGGSFGRPKKMVRCAHRHYQPSERTGRRTGFRIVLAMVSDEDNKPKAQ